MAESSSEPGYFFLPTDVWLRIAVYLDVESLQALQESDVVPPDVWVTPTLSRTVSLSPHSDASALLCYLLRCDARAVRTLRLTGCLVASPEKVFLAISVCVHLTELYCVNCIVSPRRLFDILGTSLTELTRLEWSLFEEQTYGERFDDIGASEGPVMPKLRHMYVELIGGAASACLLKRIQKRCVSLEHLRVHALHKDKSEAIAVCWSLVEPDWMLKTFSYTSQGFRENGEWSLALAQRLRVPLPDIRMTFAICGNITCRVYPAVSCSCVHLKDALYSAELVVPEEELTLCVQCCQGASTQLAEVVDRPWVRLLRSMTFVVLPSSMWMDVGCPCVSPVCPPQVSRFLGACNNLTELNLSLVHFERGTDFCQMVPPEALPLLRAIALPQCGLQTTASVDHLGASFAMLEELDVRGTDGTSVASSECPECSISFIAISSDTVAALRRGTRLQRLTLCDLRDLRCFTFLTECSCTRLRLSWPDRSMACCHGRPFVAWLSSNERLRSLTLSCPNVALSAICSDLGYAGALSLRTLCIISGVEASDYVQESVYRLSKRLPQLETLHAHYLDEHHCEHRVTWIRSWRLSCPGGRRDIEGGTFLLNTPCSQDCSMTTFIGMKKPRH